MTPPARGIEDILAEAVEIASAADREAFLDRACGADAALRERVGKLVADHFRAGSFLEYPPAALSPAPTADFDPAAGHLAADTMVGPYRVRELLGEGGMGAVYVADQEEPVKRRVALKVIRPGMDSREVVARFDQERQALALMDHPGIARVLDGGTTAEGRPYFVMELVRGLPVTEYCDRARLPARDRLVLFADVCRAVQHAHQKGVIHRDLKPSNVLVTLYDGKPVPKVIDFGVAKAVGPRLTEKTLYTRFAQLVGTPLYMSPEQAEMSAQDVDTRSDVYALGVLLYELLTGTTPFDGDALRTAGFDEMRRIIREDEPPRPSARVSTLGAEARSTASGRRGVDGRWLVRLLRGDLDRVVMKALEKDRNRRYESAGALAADVGRYLADEPVEARPASVAYRLRKFIRRNKVAATVVGMAAALLVGAGWSAADWGGRRAETHRVVAEALAETDDLQRQKKYPEALDAARRAEGLTAGGAAGRELREQTRRRRTDLELVLRLGEIRLEQTAVKDNKFDVALADRRYGEEFRAAGIDVEGSTAEEAAARIRDTSVAVELATALDDWATNRETLWKDRDPVWKHLLNVARQADPDEWRCRLRDVLETGSRRALLDLAAADGAAEQPPSSLAILGAVLCNSGEAQVAADLLREAQRRHPTDFWVNHWLAWALREVPGQREEAVRFLSVAVSLRPQSPGARLNLAEELAHKGRMEEVFAMLREAIRLKPDYAAAHGNLSNYLANSGRFAEALVAAREAVRLQPDGANNHNGLGRALEGLDQHDEAIAAYLEGIRLRPTFAVPYINLGALLSNDKQDHDAAIACFREALRLDPNNSVALRNIDIARSKQELAVFVRKTIGLPVSQKGEEAPAAAERSPALRRLLARLRATEQAEALGQAGEWDRAADVLKRQLDAIRVDLGPDHPSVIDATVRLAEARDRAGQWDEAAALARQVVEVRTEKQGRDHPDVLAALRRLADYYRRAGRWADAEPVETEQLRIATDKHGPDHEVTWGATARVALFLRHSGRNREAIPMYEQLLEKRRAKAGPDHPSTLSTLRDLGQSYLLDGRFADAERVFRDEYERRKKLGPESLEFAGTAANLGETLLALERYTDAEPLLREAIRLHNKHNHPGFQRFGVRNLLGAAFAGLGKADEAEGLLVGGYRAMKQKEARIPAPWKPYLTAAGERVVKFYEATGRPAEAEAVRKELAAARPPGR